MSLLHIGREAGYRGKIGERHQGGAQLLRYLRDQLDAVVAEVVRDVALPGEDLAEVADVVRPVVIWTMEALSASDQLPAERLQELRTAGGRAATLGQIPPAPSGPIPLHGLGALGCGNA